MLPFKSASMVGHHWIRTSVDPKHGQPPRATAPNHLLLRSHFLTLHASRYIRSSFLFIHAILFISSHHSYSHLDLCLAVHSFCVSFRVVRKLWTSGTEHLGLSLIQPTGKYIGGMDEPRNWLWPGLTLLGWPLPPRVLPPQARRRISRLNSNE